MRRLTGLRARLTAAMLVVAGFAVVMATLLSDLGLEPRVRSAAQARLGRTSEHTAEVAAAVHQESRGWTPGALRTLAHLAELDGLRVAVVKPDGLTLPVTAPPGRPQATAPVFVDGRHVGDVVVATENGALLTAEEEELHRSLDRLHLLAGVVAALAAVLVALALAETLSRPLRRIRSVASRLERGDLQARVDLGGDSEVRAVARALNRLAETLDREEQLRRTSVADLAHELRTPVNGLLLRVEAAQDGVLTGPENLAEIHAEALRLTRLLDDLACLADAERPGMLVSKTPLDLAEIARQEARLFAPHFTESEITFRVETSPVRVEADAARLAQIVANLLSNALRYTDAGGTVTLRVARHDDEAVLDVADTGIGIPAEDLPRVFTRFWRGDRSRSRDTGGTGIGLAIVRELVIAHDGRIDVDSVPGSGSTFRVSLRAVDSPGTPAPSPLT